MDCRLGRLRRAVRAFFFGKASPTGLGICRFVFYGVIFCVYADADFSSWTEVPETLWHPIFFFDFFRVPVFPDEVLRILGMSFRISILFACLGLFTRPAAAFSFVSGCYLFGMQNSFAKTHHMESLLLLVFCVLCFSRCGDGFSFDAWLRRTWRRWPFESLPEGKHPGYGWPVKLIQVLFALVFCAAGASKLRNSGLEWIASDHLAVLLVGKALAGDRIDPPLVWVAFWLWTRPVLCSFLACATVFLELLAPLALVNGYARAVVVPGLFLMMCGFWLVMGIPFPQWLAVFVFWIPWEAMFPSDGKGEPKSLRPDIAPTGS